MKWPVWHKAMKTDGASGSVMTSTIRLSFRTPGTMSPATVIKASRDHHRNSHVYLSCFSGIFLVSSLRQRNDKRTQESKVWWICVYRDWCQWHKHYTRFDYIFIPQSIFSNQEKCAGLSAEIARLVLDRLSVKKWVPLPDPERLNSVAILDYQMFD